MRDEYGVIDRALLKLGLEDVIKDKMSTYIFNNSEVNIDIS